MENFFVCHLCQCVVGGVMWVWSSTPDRTEELLAGTNRIKSSYAKKRGGGERRKRTMGNCLIDAALTIASVLHTVHCVFCKGAPCLNSSTVA